MTNSLLILQAQPNNSFRSLEIRITQVLAKTLCHQKKFKNGENAHKF